MKILLINKFFYNKGGSERVFFQLAEMLKAKGHKLMFFSMKNEKNLPSDYERYFVENIDFQKNEGFLKNAKKALHLIYSLEAKKKMRQLLLNEKPDIVHLHNISHQITPSILSEIKKYNISVVQTWHDFELICPNYQLFTKGRACQRCKKRKFFNCLRYKCMRNSLFASLTVMIEHYIQKFFQMYERGVDAYITPSNFLKNKLVEWGQPNEKITVINNAVDLNKFEPNYKPGEYILYFGRLVKEKGIMTLLKAVKHSPTIKLKIVGDGPLKSEIKRFIKSNNLSNVELLDYMDQKRLGQVIQKSKFVVLPSVIWENYSMALLEAAAYGKPAIASNVGGNPEIVKEGISGLLFDPENVEQLAEKIKFLDNNPQMIEEFGMNARKNIEVNNSLEEFYKKTVDLYERLK